MSTNAPVVSVETTSSSGAPSVPLSRDEQQADDSNDAIVPAPTTATATTETDDNQEIVANSGNHRKFSNRVFPQKLPPIPKRFKKMSAKSSKSVVKFSSKVKTRSIITSEGFQVVWHNLSFMVEKPSFFGIRCGKKSKSPSVRVILKCLSGSFKSSELTAVMGPSGAGKSTLLSCVCGKQKQGVSGDIRIVGCDRIKVAIISQNDYLTDKFTLREALLFASKTKNTDRKVDHEEVVNNVVNALSLESVFDTRLGRCSGGQRRRVSIALELVSNPNILILDEPTSGLDSVSCLQIIENLRDLTQHKKNPMAIVATIHQPSARVFNMFHNIYVISHNGQCIYHGPPDNLVHHMSYVNLTVPLYHNPADYIVEIASGEHGEESITRLATYRKESLNREINIDNNVDGQTVSSHKLSKMSQKYKFPILLHTYLLTKRSFLLLIREPHLSWIRFSMAISSSLLLSLIFSSDVDSAEGCPPRKEKLYSDNPTNIYTNYETQQKLIESNVGSLFFNTVYLLYNGVLPMLMTFTNEFNCLTKHYTNGWYSTVTYFISKLITDIPVIMICVFLYLSIWYYLTDQIEELWRYLMVLVIGILVVLNGQSQGMICSAIFSRDPVKASYLSIITTTPFFLMSGYLVRTRRMPHYLRPLTYLSYTKYGFESFVITLYGFNRCWYPETTNQTLVQPSWLRFMKVMVASIGEHNANDEDLDFVNEDGDSDEDRATNDILAMFSGQRVTTTSEHKYQSMVMSQFELNDDMLLSNLISLSVYTIVYMIIAYFVLLRQLRKSA
ncbi:ATP-binding cassette sub-family G member 1-like [Oppia nitens]|uniref:ATP-binding cassette sub-family G member 1-like n=1 Tax=Oppia nitens TaxID=1686743 RepID=UPI0023DB8B29|nr:ATP-binding cassette sub-family G member 1-like [Oppia nitens]